MTHRLIWYMYSEIKEALLERLKGQDEMLKTAAESGGLGCQYCYMAEMVR